MIKFLMCVKSLSSSLKLIELTNISNTQSSVNEPLHVQLSNFQSINSLTDLLIFTDQK